MKHTLSLGVMLIVVVLVAAACSMNQFPLGQVNYPGSGASSTPAQAVAQAPTPLASADTDPEASPAATIPSFSALTTATPLPTLAGPMGTLTAIADLVASPTQNTEPYTIVNRGVPHFIEFHAWW